MTSSEEYTYIYKNDETGIEEKYTINTDLIPNTSLLGILRNNSTTTGGYTYTKDPNIGYVISYLNNRTFVHDSAAIEILDYWGVYRTPEIIYADEEFLKSNMHNPEYVNHPMQTDMYYNLYKLDTFPEEYREATKDYTIAESILFRRSELCKFVNSYEEAKTKLMIFNHLFEAADKSGSKIFITGECVLSALRSEMKYNPENVDIFIINSSPGSIARFIRYVGSTLLNSYNIDDIVCSRSRYCLQIKTSTRQTNINYNIILKMCDSPSEALHGIDIDSACIGWDGKDIYATERGRFSLFAGYNTVLPGKITPFYEHRLIKYGLMGVGIYLPNIMKYSIDYKYIDDLTDIEIITQTIHELDDNKTIDRILKHTYDDIEYILRKHKGLSGLSLILVSEEEMRRDTNITDMVLYSDYMIELFDYRQPVFTSYKESLIQLSFEINPEQYRNIIDDDGDLPNPDIAGDVETNSPFVSDIVVISNKLTPGQCIINSLMLSEDLYTVMKRFGDIKLTADIMMHSDTFETGVISVFGNVVNEEKWYVGKVISRRCD